MPVRAVQVFLGNACETGLEEERRALVGGAKGWFEPIPTQLKFEQVKCFRQPARMANMGWVRMVLTVLLVVSANSASACQRLPTLKLPKIIEADLAMIGRIESYVFRSLDDAKVAHAVFTVQPQFPLRGVILSEQSIYWENSTFGVPRDWEKDQIVFVAAKKIDPEFRQLRGSIRDQAGNDLALEVQQPPCTTAFIFEALSPSSVVASVLVLATWMLPLILTAAALRFCLLRMRRRPVQ